MKKGMKLINPEDLKKNMCAICRDDYSDEPCDPSDCVFCNAIENAPAVDAAPVVHGWWIEKQEPISWCEDDVDVFWECSVCGGHCAGGSPYCPECGAKMDLGGA